MEIRFKKSSKCKSDDIPQMLETMNGFDTLKGYIVPHEGEMVIIENKLWVVDNVLYNFDPKGAIVIFLIRVKQ